MELGLGHSALQLYFYDGHPRAGSGICSGFLSEKVDTEEHLDGKQPFVSALCVAWAETMLDLRTFVRSPAPSGAFMEILPFLSRYEQREAAVSEGVAGHGFSVLSSYFLPRVGCWPGGPPRGAGWSWNIISYSLIPSFAPAQHRPGPQIRDANESFAKFSQSWRRPLVC